MTPDETAAFAASVAGVTARHWARAADAGRPDGSGPALAALWVAGADQGWFALGEEDALDAALAGIRELGRVACPLPVIDAFVATRVLRREEKIAGQIASGELRVLVALADGDDDEARYLDAGSAATHVLTLPPGTGAHGVPPPGDGVPPPSRPRRAGLERGGPRAAPRRRPRSPRPAPRRTPALLRLGLAARAPGGGRARTRDGDRARQDPPPVRYG